ncbi:MAG TPA: hypothetical protein VMY39_00815 [Planctomycetota bacterium]|nr:hypothetical protein [Planctomycetota bacterium]
MRKLVYWMVVYGTLATILTFVHVYSVDRVHYDSQEHEHGQILKGDSQRPYNIRVLQPLIVETVCAALPGVQRKYTFLGGYAAIRWISFLATFVAFEVFLCAYASRHVARLAVLFLAGITPLSYYGYFYQPTSVLDLCLFAVAMVIIAKGTHWPLLPLVAVATLNRNTSVFIIGAYALWHVSLLWNARAHRREIVTVGVICLLLFGVWVGIICTTEALFPADTWVQGSGHYLRYNLVTGTVWILGGITLLPLFACVAYGWRLVQTRVRTVSLLAIPYLGLHYAMAQCDEVRYWLTLYVLLGPFLTASYDRLTDSANRPPAR